MHCLCKGHKFDLVEFRARFTDGRKRQVRIDRSVAVAGKMLCRTQYAAFGQAAYHLNAETRNDIGIVAVAAHADNRIVRV